MKRQIVFGIFICMAICLVNSRSMAQTKVNKKEAKEIFKKISDILSTEPYSATMVQSNRFKKTSTYEEMTLENSKTGRHIYSKDYKEIAEGDEVLTIDHKRKTMSYILWEEGKEEELYLKEMDEYLIRENPTELMKSFFYEIIDQYAISVSKENGLFTLLLTTTKPLMVVERVEFVYDAAYKLHHYTIDYKKVFSQNWNGDPVYSSARMELKNFNFGFKKLSDAIKNYVSINGNRLKPIKYTSYKLTTH